MINQLGLTDAIRVLDNVTKRGSKSYTASCPNAEGHKHGDKNPSLSVSESADGKLLVKCHAGCEQSTVWGAMLKLTGQAEAPTKTVTPEKTLAATTSAQMDRAAKRLLEVDDAKAYLTKRGIKLETAQTLNWGYARVPIHKVEHPVITTPHYDAAGKLIGAPCRAIDTKAFTQEVGSTTSGLYAAHTLDLNPFASDVLVLEGPMDVALAQSHGFVAVGILSATSPVNQADLDRLASYDRIFLVGDQDPDGQKAMSRLQKGLPADKTVRVSMPGYKDIGDLHAKDPVNFQKNLESYLRMARGSSLREVFNFDDLLTEDDMLNFQSDCTLYLVNNLISKGNINLAYGTEKSGKTLLMYYLGKCVQNGVKAFGKYATEKTPVIYMDLENSRGDIANTIRLFQDVGPEKLRYWDRVTGVPEVNDPRLLDLCAREKPLLIMDSLSKFARDADQRDSGEMTLFFDHLLTLCAAGATIILIHHSIRADGERYANSFVIGANVGRAYAIVSKDQPKLNRIEMKCTLCRGAEPTSVSLIGIPVIKQTGHFGIADPVTAFEDLENDILRAVEKIHADNSSKGKVGKGSRCSKNHVANEVGGNYDKVLKAMDGMTERGKLLKVDAVYHTTKTLQASASSEIQPEALLEALPEAQKHLEALADFDAKTNAIN